MDFGFGAFLEKFEERFGRRITSLMLMLIGAAVIVTCIALIVNQAVLPIADAVKAAISLPETKLFSEGFITTFIGALVGFLAGGAGPVMIYLWIMKRRSTQAMAELRVVYKETIDTLEEARSLHSEARALRVQAQRVEAKIEGLENLPQSPQSTAPETQP
ncbi:MAG: hypothetical protein IBJ05_01310 [Blastomonas sp.]|nr:hypothetical protein [Blastomonas sp.]